MRTKLIDLLESSREVIADCCLENGAIVAANTDKEYYPKNVNDYRFVWPRDAAFIIYAANLLGNKNVAINFVNWLLTRAEGFAATGMLYQRYATNGARDTVFGSQYQPDQAGVLLWVLSDIFPKPRGQTARAIKLLANGLCHNWTGDCFRIVIHDLWEERRTFPSLDENFTYTLAACGFGLQCAYKLFANSRWLKVSKQMQRIINSQKSHYYMRRVGKVSDKRIDASVLGLFWPFVLKLSKTKLRNSLKQIESKLLTPQGIKRYEDDEYDGTVEHAQHWRRGGGGWPLLTFWYIIALAKSKQQRKAQKVFMNYLKQFDSLYIPEQLFPNKIQIAVSPLGWSHAMFIIAAYKLGMFRKNKLF
jgi:GH15 family glucan-1,4-alpha-glucosidase